MEDVVESFSKNKGLIHPSIMKIKNFIRGYYSKSELILLTINGKKMIKMIAKSCGLPSGSFEIKKLEYIKNNLDLIIKEAKEIQERMK